MTNQLFLEIVVVSSALASLIAWRVAARRDQSWKRRLATIGL
jgi:hypothetical protein